MLTNLFPPAKALIFGVSPIEISNMKIGDGVNRISKIEEHSNWFLVSLTEVTNVRCARIPRKRSQSNTRRFLVGFAIST